MSLIDMYVHEVAKRLPEQNREDITLELRSTIEDMLPDDYNEEDVKSILKNWEVQFHWLMGTWIDQCI